MGMVYVSCGVFMKIEEYSDKVMAKAITILKENRGMVEYPITDEQILNEKKLWRFFVIHGKDKRPNKVGFYTDIHGDKGNIVFYHMEKDIWTCSCMHYAFTASENCKHILSCKLRYDTFVKEAKARVEASQKEKMGGKTSLIDKSFKKEGLK